jgi:hypothetical protein
MLGSAPMDRGVKPTLSAKWPQGLTGRVFRAKPTDPPGPQTAPGALRAAVGAWEALGGGAGLSWADYGDPLRSAKAGMGPRSARQGVAYGDPTPLQKPPARYARWFEALGPYFRNRSTESSTMPWSA